MNIKILVADDSASERLMIKNMLSGYDVLTACDGAEALKVLNANDDISILILDLDMPEIDGFRLLEAMQGNERFRNLRTIILTERNEVENEIKCLRLGAVDYIRKPVNMYSLKARVDIHAALLCTQWNLEHKLDEQIQTFDLIFSQAPIGIAISQELKYSKKPVLRINSMFERITGRTKEELERLGWEKITHPDDLKEDIEKFRKLRKGEISMYAMDKRYIRPDGSIVWVHMVVAPLIVSKDQIFEHICLIEDITERKEVEKALRESERSKSVFLSHLPGLAYRRSYDHNWTMQFVSEGCYNLTGYPPESFLNNRDLSYNDIISPEYRENLLNKWKKAIDEKKPFKYEYEIITATGQRKWVLELGQGVYNGHGEAEALEGIILDISDRKTVENALKYNNEHVRWTGLYNRDYLIALLEHDLKAQKNSKKALIGIDLSAAQLLTIKYGFQYMQDLLKKTAEALNKFCTGNRLLFHILENRFVFYVHDYKDRKELVNFGNAIAETLESLYVTDRINGGIGIVEIGQDNEETDPELIMRRLLIASEKSVSLYEKDYVICFYDEELEAAVKREIDIEDALNSIAMGGSAKDELFLQYQPILDLKTGRICGFEALSRIKTEKLGIVPPSEFIPIAEKTKLIIPIGDKVIVNAFGFLKKLNTSGYDNVYVSINISVIQLLKPDFADRFLGLMKEMDINPANVCLEITETVFASDFGYINKTIGKLKNAGISIAIDDFGKGYSSLAREKGLDVDCLKIDKFFVDNLLDADPDKVITSDIISMSHKLGHFIVAEGVEHAVQLHYLLEHDCDRVQGYLISKPLDEQDTIEFLRKQNS